MASTIFLTRAKPTPTPRTPERLAARWPGVYRAVSHKYFVDEFYERSVDQYVRHVICKQCGIKPDVSAL